MRLHEALESFFIDFRCQDGVSVSAQDDYSRWIRGPVDRHNPPDLIVNNGNRYMSHFAISFCLTQL
jgi:hypothetical protein